MSDLREVINKDKDKVVKLPKSKFENDIKSVLKELNEAAEEGTMSSLLVITVEGENINSSVAHYAGDMSLEKLAWVKWYFNKWLESMILESLEDEYDSGYEE